MKRFYNQLIFALTFLFTINSFAQTDDTWKLNYESSGIKIYTQNVISKNIKYVFFKIENSSNNELEIDWKGKFLFNDKNEVLIDRSFNILSKPNTVVTSNLNNSNKLNPINAYKYVSVLEDGICEYVMYNVTTKTN